MKITVKRSRKWLRQKYYLRITHPNGEPVPEMFVTHTAAVDSAHAIANAKKWTVVDETSIL